MPSNDATTILMSTLPSILANSTDGIEVVDEFLEQPERWQTWLYGLSIVSITAFSAPLAMLLTPLLKKSLYDKCMTFLVSLGIGAMSGSCLFILLPHAFNIGQVNESEYLQKCILIAGAIYAFFGVDRLLQCFIEMKRRRKHHSKVHASTIDSLTNNYKKASIIVRKTRKNADPEIPMRVYTTTDNEQLEHEKEQLRDEIDVANYTSTLARTLSTRRRVAVIKPEPLDKIQYEKPDGSVINIDTKSLGSPLSSRNPSPLASPQHTVHNGNFKYMPGNNMVPLSEIPSEVKLPDTDKVGVTVEIQEKHIIEKVEIASVAYMIIFGSSMNNFVDGMSIGAAFSDSVVRGIGIGLAVMAEQMPQELGTLAILINSGLGLRRTLIFSIVPMVLSFLGFTAGVYLDNLDDSYDGLIFAVSAGMYLYIVLGTLLPEIREQFNEELRTDMRKATVTTLLQICGIFSGLSLMFLMNVHNEEI